MRISRENIRKLEGAEQHFFDVDEKTKEVKIPLHFASPDEIFDPNCPSKVPMFTDDFSDWVRDAFDLVPKGYRIDLTISFDDAKGYTEEELMSVFRSNMLLNAQTSLQRIHIRKRVAYGLVCAGLLSFIAMMLISRLWHSDSFWHEMFFYALDIATTVLFWEAVGILLVESREHKIVAQSYMEKFSSIRFETKK